VSGIGEDFLGEDVLGDSEIIRRMDAVIIAIQQQQ
jgi:hypothetical protein